MSDDDMDYLKLASHPAVIKVLQTRGNNFPEAESLELSRMVTKINRKGKEQDRILIISQKAL